MEYIGKISDDYLLNCNCDIVICGCGQTGKRVLLNLQNRGLDSNVVGFCDSNAELIGTYVMGKLVYTYKSMVHLKPEAAYLIACADILPLVKILSDEGIKKIHITR